MSNSPGLVDFEIGLVDSDHHLPDRQVKFFWELKLQSYYKTYFLDFQVDLCEPKADLTKEKYFEKSVALHFMPERMHEIFPL